MEIAGLGVEEKVVEEKEKNRKGRKKADPQFETGFLFSMGKQELADEMKVQDDENVRESFNYIQQNQPRRGRC